MDFLKTSIQSVQRSLSLLIQRTLFLMFSLFEKYFIPQIRNDKLKQCYLPPLSFKISPKDKSFYISLNSWGFYLSPECLLNFLKLLYSTMCGKTFSVYGVHMPRKCNESMYFYSCHSPPLKNPCRIFWKSVSSKTKVVEEIMIFFIKIQSENMKMTWNSSLFIFSMICNFSKCDSFTVLWIIPIKQCGIKSIASSLQTW